MISKIEGPAVVKYSKISNTIEGKVKITRFEDHKDNGMETSLVIVTETIGIEILTIRVILIGVEDGTIIEVRDIVIREEGEDGIPINITMIQGINNRPNFLTLIIIIHSLWDTNTGTQSHMRNTPTHSNNNISPKCRQHHLNKLQIFVNCVTVKVIMTINTNLQAISLPAHKKPSIKVDHTAIKTLITGNGHMVILTIMILMHNLFSRGGSRCR